MKHAVKKLGMMLLTMLIVSFLAFLAFQVIPGDPTNTILGTDATPEQVAALRAQLGLDRPFFVRYFDWLFSFIRGDFGTSYSYSMPVADMLSGKLGVTLLLAALSFLLTVVVSIPVGILSADRGGWLDKALTVSGQITMAIPPFFIGILLTYLFGLILRWFTPGEFIAPSVDFGGSVAYLIYPAVAIALPRIAMTVRMLRSTIVYEMNSDYVRTAISRGNDRPNVLWRHVLRNALAPVVAFLAQTMAEVVAGSIVVEQVFGVPGLGRLLLGGISGRDWPVVQSIIVILAFWVVLAGTLGDLVSQRIDPRLRLGGDRE